MTVCWLSLILFAANPSAPIVRPSDNPTAVEVTVKLSASQAKRLKSGRLDAELGQKLLTFSLVDEQDRTGEPIFGSYERDKTTLIFRPRFGLVRGSRYRATFQTADASDKARELTSDYLVPSVASKSAAVVEAVYPSGSDVPANLLKFYLHFSQPMREGREIFAHLHLLDDEGQPMEAPWRETELWSADARRLTLWIHPGRIKQGVALRDDLGPVLTPGRKYALLIDAEMRDAQGQPLGKSFRKEFRTTKELRERVNLRDWKLTTPSANSFQPLAIQFSRPLDRHLAARCLHVRDADGRDVAGTVTVSDSERRWHFQPRQPWSAQDYETTVDPILEDLAGNSVERVFDDDTTDASTESPEPFLKLTWKPQ